MEEFSFTVKLIFSFIISRKKKTTSKYSTYNEIFKCSSTSYIYLHDFYLTGNIDSFSPENGSVTYTALQLNFTFFTTVSVTKNTFSVTITSEERTSFTANALEPLPVGVSTSTSYTVVTDTANTPNITNTTYPKGENASLTVFVIMFKNSDTLVSGNYHAENSCFLTSSSINVSQSYS